MNKTYNADNVEVGASMENGSSVVAVDWVTRTTCGAENRSFDGVAKGSVSIKGSDDIPAYETVI